MAKAAALPLIALRILGIAILALLALALLFVLLLVIFVRSEVLEDQVRQRVLPMVSERLGREVTVEGVDAFILPSPHVRIGGLRVAGRTEVPIFTSEEVEARLRIWPLVTSRGRRMVLDQLRFEAPNANLVRLPSGNWDIPRPPPAKRRIQVDLEDIALDRGNLRVVDARGQTTFEIEELAARASFLASTLAFRSLEGKAYGAELDGGGTRIELGAQPMVWNLDASVDEIQLQRLPIRNDPLLGNLALAARLTGEDLLPARIGQTASGTGSVQARDLVWRTLDLSGAISLALGQLFEGVGLEVAPPASSGQTRLGNWDRSLLVRNGWVEMEEPLEVDSGVGETRIGGRWSLGARLDLEAQTALEAEYVRALTRGELRPDEPVPIRYRIRGSFSRPRIEELDASAFLPLLAEEGARRLRKGLEKILPPLGTGTTEP